MKVNFKKVPVRLCSLLLPWFLLLINVHCFKYTLSDFLNADGPPPKDEDVVGEAKENLAIVYAEGDSASSVTRDIILPTAGAGEVVITWESSNSEIIAISEADGADDENGNRMGVVTRPTDMDTAVTLTATLTKNDTSDTREFPLTVVLPCTTSEMTAKLKADPPSLSGCSAASIQGADMPALRSAGVVSAQFLAVWSADADTGFTPAQLKEGGVTVAEMRSAEIPDYLVFNEVCNTPRTINRVTLTSSSLTATDTMVVLEGKSDLSLRWRISADDASFDRRTDSIGTTRTLGSATARYVRNEGTIGIVSTLSIPLADVFSNPTVEFFNHSRRRTNIPLCPGR